MPPTTLSAQEIVALGDAELDAYLEQQRRPNGEILVDVAVGWDHVPKDQRDRFIDRLRCDTILRLIGCPHFLRRDRDRAHGGGPAASRAIDLGQVAKRLLEIPVDDTSPPPRREAPRKERTPTPPAETEEDMERESYPELVKDGGRPCYPFHLLDEIFKDPERYREMMAPWRGWCIGAVTQQLESWKEFRQWQKFNRKDYSEWGTTRFHLCKMAFTPFLREFQLRDGGLLEYAEAVGTLLANDDFYRPFGLEEDPTEQDQLSTWIEYLGYEYWQYRWATLRISRLQQRYDEAMSALQSGQYSDDDLPKYQSTIRGYDDAKEKSRLHGPLARWIRDQVPLVEAEMEVTKAARATPGSSRSRKRRPGTDVDVTAESQTSEEWRRSSKRTSPSDKAWNSTKTTTRSKRLRKDDTVDEEPSSKRLGTSGHIADPRHAPSSKANVSTTGKPRNLRGRKRQNGTTEVVDTKGKASAKSKGLRTNRAPKSAGEPSKRRRSARIAALQTR